MERIEELMQELQTAYRKKDYADMANIIQLELLDLLKEKAQGRQ